MLPTFHCYPKLLEHILYHSAIPTSATLIQCKRGTADGEEIKNSNGKKIKSIEGSRFDASKERSSSYGTE